MPIQGYDPYYPCDPGQGAATICDQLQTIASGTQAPGDRFVVIGADGVCKTIVIDPADANAIHGTETGDAPTGTPTAPVSPPAADATGDTYIEHFDNGNVYWTWDGTSWVYNFTDVHPPAVVASITQTDCDGVTSAPKDNIDLTGYRKTLLNDENSGNVAANSNLIQKDSSDNCSDLLGLKPGARCQLLRTQADNQTVEWEDTQIVDAIRVPLTNGSVVDSSGPFAILVVGTATYTNNTDCVQMVNLAANGQVNFNVTDGAPRDYYADTNFRVRSSVPAVDGSTLRRWAFVYKQRYEFNAQGADNKKSGEVNVHHMLQPGQSVTYTIDIEVNRLLNIENDEFFFLNGRANIQVWGLDT